MLDGDEPGVRILPGVPHGDEAPLMTEMADEIKIRMTLYHDRSVLRTVEARRIDAEVVLGALVPVFMNPGSQGKHITGDSSTIEVIWENSGLQEIPEESGGDN
jgi:hypothetical protein